MSEAKVIDPTKGGLLEGQPPPIVTFAPADDQSAALKASEILVNPAVPLQANNVIVVA